jgi:thiamine biosynthesis lipoprotein
LGLTRVFWVRGKGAVRITRFLMGTVVQIEARGEGLEPAVRAALKEMARIERLMSRFLPGSDVARLNATCCRPVMVSPETFTVVEKALLFSRLSGGAFDITIASENGAGHRDVLLDKEACRVSLRKPGMALDLGGIAKGYAVDRAVEVLQGMGVQDALVNAGGDIRVLGHRSPHKGWLIGVQHPRAQNSLLCQLPLANKAVATSGDYYKCCFRRGHRQPHILDPRRGEPAQGSLTATVVADQTLVADALATAAFVLGPEEGINLIESLPGVEGLVVGGDGSIKTSSGLEARWDQGPEPRIEDSPITGIHLSSLRIPLGTIALISALAVSCQGGVVAQPTPVLMQPGPTITAGAKVLMDGTYKGESVSGVLVQVEVTVQEGRISDIQILEYREISSIHAGKPTAGEEESWQARREEVLRTIPKRIIDKQSTSVDAITGATMSSETIMAAVEDALTKAMPQTVR